MREFYTIFILRLSVKHFGPYNKIVSRFLRYLDVRVLEVISSQYG